MCRPRGARSHWIRLVPLVARSARMPRIRLLVMAGAVSRVSLFILVGFGVVVAVLRTALIRLGVAVAVL